MELENTFKVPVPLDEAWALLLDVERVALCMPGATLESVDGDEMTGRVQVKLGPISMTYQGKARFVERDDANHTLAMEASGKDVRGAGGAKATMRMHLVDLDGVTECTVKTDLAVTGKAAQFGRGVMADVSAKLVGEFARRLAQEVENPRPNAVQEEEPQVAGATGPAPPQVGEDDVINLLEAVDLRVIARKAAPGVLLVMVLLMVLRRRSR